MQPIRWTTSGRKMTAWQRRYLVRFMVTVKIIHHHDVYACIHTRTSIPTQIFAAFPDNILDGISHLGHTEAYLSVSQEQTKSWTIFLFNLFIFYHRIPFMSTIFLFSWDELVPRELGCVFVHSWYIAACLCNAVSGYISGCHGGLRWVTMTSHGTSEPVWIY